MACACKEKDFNKKVIVSEGTCLAAQSMIRFKYYKSEKFKGKSMELPVYLPLMHNNNDDDFEEEEDGLINAKKKAEIK